MSAETVTLLYSCDNWHMKDSMFLHGAFINRAAALLAIEELLSKQSYENYPDLTDEDRDLFLRIGQTQGYAGEGEWYSQELIVGEIDSWL